MHILFPVALISGSNLYMEAQQLTISDFPIVAFHQSILLSFYTLYLKTTGGTVIFFDCSSLLHSIIVILESNMYLE